MALIDTLRWGSGGYARSNPNPAISALACMPGGDLIAIGRFDFIRSAGTTIRCNNAARWNGITWSSLNLPDSLSDNNNYENTLQSIVINKAGRIYVGSASAFTPKSTSIKAHLLYYETGTWTLLAKDDAQIVPYKTYELLIDSSGSVYRNFTTNKIENGFSVYDGSTWTNINFLEHPELIWTSSLVSGPDHSIYCINYDNNGHYYVMQYSSAGFPTSTLKKLTAPFDKDRLFRIHAGQLRLNVPEKFRGKDIMITLGTLSGRVVRSIESRGICDLIPFPGLRLSPGIYLLTVDNRKESLSSRVMITR